MNLQSENINEVASALAKAQGKIVTAKKDKKNPFFKSSYADLSSVWDACRSALSDNGIAVIQSINTPDNKPMELVTILAHSSGQWFRSQMPIITTKNDPQSLGSALTYYRRYALAAIVGVAASDDDDDGNIASDRSEQKKYDPKPNEQKAPARDLITKFQANELDAMLSRCGEGYRNQVLSFIKKDPISANTIDQLPSSEYQRVMNAAKKKYEEQQQFVNEPRYQEAVNAG
jgi:hypothetical protein